MSGEPTDELVEGLTAGGGRFVLIRVLGAGGMGVVWLAMDQELNEEVALKFLPRGIQSDPMAMDDMRRETLKSRRLSHPNITRIHDFYHIEDELPFICMEFVDGQNLSEMQVQQESRVFRWRDIEGLVQQLCDSLA
ncbi:protein kinase, partial [Verrucomicrobia bacterium]|nr:protein kinase [Verrucomicrobiota bacterium]